MNTYTFIEDPGHGWLKVSKKEITPIQCLSIGISGCSYHDETHWYFEEDCDLTRFMHFKGFAEGDWGTKYEFTYERHYNDWPGRDLPRVGQPRASNASGILPA